MTSKIEAWIKRHGLLRKGDCVLVAVSGGADSVAMLCALLQLAGKLGVRIEVVHLDHGIRNESREDAEFVRALAARFGLPAHLHRADVPRLARNAGVSLEMAARDARLAMFADASKRLGAACVATAHTADDQAETVLLRLMRGCGPRGLGGMAPASRIGDLRLIHPMLCVRRAEVVRYLTGLRMAWREDASNRCSDFLRNRVRHEVLPLLEGRLNPAARDAIVRTADLLREDAEWLDALGAQALDGLLDAHANVPGPPRDPSSTPAPPPPPGTMPPLDLAALNAMPKALQRRVLRLWLVRGGQPPESLAYRTIEDVLDLAATTRGTRGVDLPAGTRVVRRYGRLHHVPGGGASSPPPYCRRIRVPGETLLPEQDLRIVAEKKEGLERQPRASIGAFPAWATLSANALAGKRLWVRSWRAGDRIAPLGMKGSRKLQDIFVDAKVPSFARAGLPVVTDGARILWLPGYRVARGCEVIASNCKNIHLRVERL